MQQRFFALDVQKKIASDNFASISFLLFKIASWLVKNASKLENKRK